MSAISYVKGDATSPQGEGAKVILHICNDIGGWGKGFVLAISRRWKEPESAYRAWHSSGGGFALGEVQLVQVEPLVWVANLIGQHGISAGPSGPPIRYDAVATCLRKTGDKAIALAASAHMPRIGCGLAGGEWSKIAPLVQEHLADRGVAVTVYDLA
jgi:O-acetyl-ADP-ribose deacetylase (regulator of RNase III)